MRRCLCLLLCLLLLFPTLCACAPTAPSESLPLVVTSIFPLYDFCRVLLGEHARCELLLPPGADIHSYEPTVQDLFRMTDCDLFVYVGGHSESHLKRMLSDSGAQNGYALLEHLSTDTVSHDHGHTHESADEHVWTSPRRAIEIVRLLAEHLCQLFPALAQDVRENQARYSEQLSALDARFSTLSDSDGLLLFADSFPFLYLSEDYSLPYLSAMDGCGEDTEPSASRLAEMIEQGRERGLQTVFYTETSNEKIVSSLAQALDARALLLHSCHNLTQDEHNQGLTYLLLMERNFEHISVAFQ